MMRALPYLLVALGAALLAGGLVFALPDGDDRPEPEVAESSVDAGFARDMATHHEQAVRMAAYTRQHATTADVRALAAESDSQQQLEVGQLIGWLEAWGLPRAADLPAMSWMGGHGAHHGAAMPGMATPAELDELVNLTDTALEIRFLQLMIRHHDGGLPVARHAAAHAQRNHVRAFAAQLAVSQGRESDLMRQLLRARGGTPLPPA